MDTCKYHPLRATVFHCEKCQIATCEDCVDFHEQAKEPRCIHCMGPLVSVVNSENIEPFWRRIEQAFKYPLNSSTLFLIVLLSVVTTVVGEFFGTNLITLLVTLAAFGGLLKYSFMCMIETSEGEFSPPDISEAFTGGLGLAFKMIAMIVLMIASVVVLAFYVHPIVALVAGVLYLVGLPAVIITFAHTQSVFAALNPVLFLGLIWRIGFPYAVLLGFLMIMTGSVSLIDSIIGDSYSAVSGVFSMIVSNYYTVVMFHIMGYMLYQYKDRLGFSTDSVSDTLLQARNSLDNLYAQIEVVIKEGNYSKAAQLFQQGFQQAPNDKRFSDNLVEFAVQANQKQLLNNIADRYLLQLANEHSASRLPAQFRRIQQLLPNFTPQLALVRWRLAQRSYEQGDYAQTIKLLNGLHKSDSQFSELVPAYDCLADALEATGKTEVANQCRLLVKKLHAQRPIASNATVKPASTGPASFATEQAQPMANAAHFSEPVSETEADPHAPKDLPDIEFTRG